MLEKIIIISLITFAIYATMQEGMIFEKLGNFFERVLGDFWSKPVNSCPVCMAFWYGLVICLIFGWALWLPVAAMGLNYVLIRMFNE